MRAIFISYRRDDSEGQAGRLYGDLVRIFGDASVFIDVAGIEPGVDFRQVIEKSVSSCAVLLTLIGPGWLTTKTEAGQRRLDDPTDFVRLETAAALKRGIPVLPVLVHGARMPTPEQLPEDIKELAYRNGLELSHARWDFDLTVLIRALQKYLGEEKDGPAEEKRHEAQPGTSLPQRPDSQLQGALDPASKPAKKLPRWFPVVLTSAIVLTAAMLCAVLVGIVLFLRRKAPQPVATAEPTISEFVASPNEVAQGGTVHLHWAAENADQIVLEPYGEVTAKGDTIDQPQSTIIYTLKATKQGGGSSSAFQTVIVNQPASATKAPSISPAQSPDTQHPNFAGVWSEVDPANSGHPLRLKIEQNGADIAVYISYTQVFASKSFLQATLQDGKATTSIPQGCAKMFQHPGANYDNPGVNVFTISMREATLIYEQDTRWASPCDGHPIGAEKNIRRLQRVSP